MRTTAALVPLILLAVLLNCTKPPSTASESAASKETGLESIPPPDPAKYPGFSDLSQWRNPYLDGIGFVDQSNHEVRVLQPEQIQAELVSLPESAWPYGRVVLIAEAVPKNPTDQVKAEIRKNRGLLAGTLKELDVQIREVP